MFETLKTLAIGVESYITTEEAEAAARLAQESKEKTFWIIMLAIFLVAELFFAVIFPKYLKKYKENQAQKAENKARRKAIQSKRKKEY